MTDLKQRVKATIKKYGADAPAHFGVKKTTLEGYVNSGEYPLKFVEKILSDTPGDGQAPEPEPAPPPPPHVQERVRQGGSDARLAEVITYIQNVIDPYIREFVHRIDILEKQVRAGQLQAASDAQSRTA